MLNRPKFMMPSTNVQEKTIDVNADTITFSCIVDGNEAINAWQITICKLNDNNVVFDTGVQELKDLFYPVNNRNQNVVFSKDLKKLNMFPTSSDIYVLNSDVVYNPNRKYYKYYEGSNSYVEYTYVDDDNWETARQTLYVENFINAEEPYYWTITFWGVSGTSITSCEEVFYANPTPIIKLQYGKEITTEDGSTYIEYTDYSDEEETVILDSREYYFKADYSDTQGVELIKLKRYGWRITDIDHGQVIIDTISNNQIYGVVDDITCFCNGFVNNSRYSVEVLIETQNDACIISAPKNFSVEYEMSFLTNDFKTENLKREPAVILDWSDSVVIGGKMLNDTGDALKPEYVPYRSLYPFVDKDKVNASVVIPKNNLIVYDYGATSNLDIPEDSYIVLSTQLMNNEDFVLFSAEGIDEDGNEIIRKLSFNEGDFVYSVLGKQNIMLTKTYTPRYLPSEYVWYVISMSPILVDDKGDNYISFRVNESVAVGGLYPSAALYPSDNDNTYPSYGDWELKVEGGE